MEGRMALGAQQQVEFSRLVSPETVSEDESLRRIEATEDECKALAARFGLLSLDRLEATLTLRRPRPGRLIRVTGHFEAAVVQACVTSLEPVSGLVSEEVALAFSVARRPGQEPRQVDVPAEGEDSPEAIGPEGLDLGETVAQLLAMALDPYPRAPGVRMAQDQWGDDEAEEETSGGVFAQLEVLKRKQ
jgi:uncharacterized metal-binding protein YceD (DUF177 family)